MEAVEAAVDTVVDSAEAAEAEVKVIISNLSFSEDSQFFLYFSTNNLLSRLKLLFIFEEN